MSRKFVVRNGRFIACDTLDEDDPEYEDPEDILGDRADTDPEEYIPLEEVDDDGE